MALRWMKRLAEKDSGNNDGKIHWTLRRSVKRNSRRKVNPPTAVSVSKVSKRKSVKRQQKQLTIGDDEGPFLLTSTTLGDSLDALEVIQTDTGARVKIALFGGCVYSYLNCTGEEKLFLSEESKLDGSKPIRGGIPVVFPQFGSKGELSMSHGFARTSIWELAGEPKVIGDMIQVSLKLASSKQTRKLWNHDFELQHHIRFGANELETCLQIQNKGKKSFEFQALLHTYLKVKDVSHVQIGGLEESFIDQLHFVMPGEERQVFIEKADVVTIPSQIDNIYLGQRQPIIVKQPKQKNIEINVEVLREDTLDECDVVVWNPHMDKSKRLEDFGNEEYAEMLCIEPGIVSHLESCKPQQTWSITQNIKF